MDDIIKAVIFFILLSISGSCAIRCYSFDTDTDGPGIPHSDHAVTCPQIISSCLITTTILHGVITRRHYHCAIGVNCHTVAEQRNATYIHVQNCCHGHLCNNGININNLPVFESGKNYCYSAHCSGENCLSNLLAIIDRDKLGTFCNQDGEKCLTQTRKLISTDETRTIGPGFEMRSYEYWTGCATQEHPCFPSTSHDMTVTCCTEHLCNAVNYTGGQDKPQTNECYVVSCTGDSKDCLQESIKSKSYTLCTQSNFGCEAALTRTSDDNVYTLGCSTSLCVPGYERSQDKTVIGCCSGDRCFPKFHHIGPSNVAACLNAATMILLFAISFLVIL